MVAEYHNQSKLRFWCQMVLPLVYDDSLSYMELLNKVVSYLNNCIQDVGNCETNIESLLEAFVNLQDYVNEITEDISPLIEEKIDEMIESGEFGEILADALATVVSPEYDSTENYVPLNYVIKDGQLYCCTANTTGEWDSTKWRETTVGDELNTLMQKVYSLNAGDVSFDPTETYASGTVGNKLKNLTANDVEYNSSQTYNNATVGKELSNLNGAINSKAEYVDLGSISSATYPTIPAQIERAFSIIAITNKPVVFHYTCNGEWSGIAYKYAFQNKSYGFIYTSNFVASYIGYISADTFTCDQIAKEGEIANKLDYIDLGAISGSAYKDIIENAFNAITIYDKPVSIKFSSGGIWSGIAYKYSNVNYGTIYATYPVDRISYFGYMVNGTFNVYLNATEADITNLTTVNDVTTELALTSPYTIRLQEAKKVRKIVTLRCAINNGGNAFNIQSGFSARVNPLCQITKYKPAIQIQCTAYLSNNINSITDGFGSTIIQTNGNVLCDMVTSTTREITITITYITNE